MTIHEKIRRLLELRGLSASATAQLAGLSDGAIRDMLSKKTVPRIDNAKAIATALGVTLDWLADDAKDWPPETSVTVESICDLLGPVAEEKFRAMCTNDFGMDVVAAAAIITLIELADGKKNVDAHRSLATTLYEKTKLRSRLAHLSRASLAALNRKLRNTVNADVDVDAESESRQRRSKKTK